MELTRIDEDYENRMLSFEIDCNDGKGDALPCHQVGEYLAVVKEEHIKASQVFEKNCNTKGYDPSCFILGRFYFTGKGVEQDDKKAESLFGKQANRLIQIDIKVL